jgi:hypothetical protein
MNSLIPVNPIDFDNTRSIQGRKRTDCHAAFTTTPGGIIWPFANFGNTDPEYKEINLRGYFSFLDEVADLFLKSHPNGGRFFISKAGAGSTPEESHSTDLAFVRFTFP